MAATFAGLYSRLAKAGVDISSSFALGSLPGVFRYHENGSSKAGCNAPYNFCLNNSIFLEISQKDATGKKNSLDAKETWAKSYVESNRLGAAKIGIYDGQYGRTIDDANNHLDYDSNATSATFGDSGVATFEFYIAQDFKRVTGEFDERPCKISGDDTPFLTLRSDRMTKKSWKAIDVSDELNRPSAKKIVSDCIASNKGGMSTQKTNRVVLFTKVYWTDGNNKEGRVNAFKVGTAYTDKNNDLSNTGLTGYYSYYDSATNSSGGDAGKYPGAYAIQNRVDASTIQGEYYFSFAPDCYLAPGKTQDRYLKWKDVDYPNYYSAPGMAPPSFKLIDVTDKSKPVTKLTVSGSDLGGPDKFKEAKLRFDGGHIYEWHWYNIASNDGIVFWIPYDDFPALVGGCGEYSYNVGLKAGTTTLPAISSNTEFRATGGQTVAANLTQLWGGKDAGSDTSTDLYLSAAGASTVDSAFTPQTPTVGGSTALENTFLGKRYHTVWKLPRLGPSPTYNPSRSDLYAYFKVKNDAPDGSRYCFTASISPTSNSNAASNPSNPKSICVTIDNSLKPFLATSGADVHAGDCTIDKALNGKVTGQVSPDGVLGSSGSYIVSAGDAITQFGSGGSPGGTNLTFGKTGRYGKLCRPSLADLQAELAKGGFTPVPGDSATPYDLGKLAAGGKYLVYFNGPGTVFGKANAPVTVYSTGTLTIQGAEFGSSVRAATSRTNLPVVGVIAQDIKIKKEVNGITAQLYATGNIDTCSDSSTVNCRSTLLLRGFAMAHDFSFKRSGTGSNGLQLAELFGFNAAFYLNPPPGFGSAAGAVKYLGERAPLY